MKRDYHDRTQVAPYWDAYLARFGELEAAGRYPYNDDFKGRIGAPEADEDFLIYMCQKERRLRDDEAKVAAALADGCVPIASVNGVERFARVIRYGWYVGGTGWQEWADARLTTTTWGALAVIPKGRRTRGHVLDGGTVLVKRESAR